MPGPVPPAEVPLRAVALRLQPLLQPHRAKGRLALRIERVPQLARLSRGRNNGDGSWSLASDEIEGLEYMAPDGADVPMLMMVRIIGLEQDGATLAVHELGIDGDNAEPDMAADAGADDAYLQGLDAELKTAKAALAAREAELAVLRRNAPADGKGKDELAAARAAWEAEMERRLTDAAAGAAQSAERQARQWQQGEAERLAAAQAKWTEATVQAATLARSQAEAQAATALAAAEARWKAAEAERLGAAEAQWREAAAKTPRTDLGYVDEEALQAARSQLTQAHKQVIQYEDDLRRTQHALEAAKAGAQKEQAEGLARAEAEWKRGESERMAAVAAEWKRAEGERLVTAETAWRSKAAADLAALTARCEGAERALATGADQQTARDAELKRMREERTVLQTKFAEAERAQAAAANDAARKLVETALGEAKTAWQAEEAARLVAAENQWRAEAKAASDAALNRLRDEHAAVQSKQAESARAQSAVAGEAVRQQIETALGAAKAAWKSEEAGRLALAETTWRAEAKAAHDVELSRLRDENAALQAKAADAERIRAATSGDATRQQVETVLGDARAAWKAEESARLAAAEAVWRAKSTTDLAALTARCEAAEKAATQALPGQDDAERKRLEEECAGLRTKLAAAERGAGPPADLRQQIDAALTDAKSGWKAEEAARLAAAQEKWRSDASAALARATQRADVAEAQLAQARAGGASTGAYDQAFIDGLRDEISSLRRGLADREIELAQARLTLDPRHPVPETSAPAPQHTRITLERTPREREVEHQPVDPARNRRLIRDVSIVFAFVAVVFLGFPLLVPYLPYDWQEEIYDLETSTGLFGAAPATDTAPPAPAKPAKPATPRPLPALPTLSVLKPANVRKDPDAGAAVVTHLKRGDAVVIVETRGNWTHVRTDGGEGWVFSSYLGKASP